MTDPYRAQTHSHAPEPWSPPPTPAPTGAADSASTTDQAKDAARGVASDAQGAGRAVAETARSEAASVKDDAVREGRKLWDETASTLSTQASDQMSRAAGTVRTFTDDLSAMARGEQPDEGLATDLAGQVTDRTDSLANWLEHHEPSDLLQEVQRFARRRPVAFLAIAAGIGFAAGRITRGAAQSHLDAGDSGQHSGGGSPRHVTAGGQYEAAGRQYSYQPSGQVPPPPVGAPMPGAPGTGAPVPPVPPVPGVGVPDRPGAALPQQPPYDASATPVEPTLPADPHATDPHGRGGAR